MKEKVTLKISADLAGKLASKMDEAGFDSLTEYVEFILEQVAENSDPSESVTEKDEEEVRRRLKDMGYL